MVGIVKRIRIYQLKIYFIPCFYILYMHRC